MSKIISYIRAELWRRNRSFLCVFIGDTGSGKSLSACSMARAIQLDWDLSQLCFYPSEFLDLLNDPEKTKKGNVLVWDEIGAVGMPARDWMKVQNKLVGAVMQTMRHRNIAILFTTPNLSFIDYQLRVLLHAQAEPQYINRKEKICRCEFKFIKVDRETGKIFRKFARVWENGKRIKKPWLDFHLPPSPIPEQYEPKAKEFKDSLSKNAREAIRAIEQRLNPINSKKEARQLFRKGMKPPELAERLDVSKMTIYRWVKGL